jgi:hypothetical protein
LYKCCIRRSESGKSQCESAFDILIALHHFFIGTIR